MGFTVAVLMGGRSAEREVSLATGHAIATALEELGHRVVEVDARSDLPAHLREAGPDVVFLALHGRGGEDGTVQGLLEVMGIPYTGCGVLSSALTMDKVMTKRLLEYSAVPVASDVVVTRQGRRESSRVAGELGFPVMVKPATEGSSIGVYKVASNIELEAALDDVFGMDDRALVEEYIDGRLLTVGIVGTPPVVLPVLEIKPRDGFYDYVHKYRPGTTDYEVPAKLDERVSDLACALSLRSFDVCMCEGVGRIDLMLENGTGRMVVLEVNTIPGMTETSNLPMAAASMGMTFNEVVQAILDSARLKVEMAEGP
ncbi:MAG: D-alanine--D-alanine ligase [Actinomycetota bacterium]